MKVERCNCGGSIGIFLIPDGFKKIMNQQIKVSVILFKCLSCGYEKDYQFEGIPSPEDWKNWEEGELPGEWPERAVSSASFSKAMKSWILKNQDGGQVYLDAGKIKK